MSSYHTNPSTFQQQLPKFGRLPVRLGSHHLAAIRGVTGKLVSAFHNRLTCQRIERFSDDSLNDIGLDRDWDGTIICKQ